MSKINVISEWLSQWSELSGWVSCPPNMQIKVKPPGEVTKKPGRGGKPSRRERDRRSCKSPSLQCSPDNQSYHNWSESSQELSLQWSSHQLLIFLWETHHQRLDLLIPALILSEVTHYIRDVCQKKNGKMWEFWRRKKQGGSTRIPLPFFTAFNIGDPP